MDLILLVTRFAIDGGCNIFVCCQKTWLSSMKFIHQVQNQIITVPLLLPSFSRLDLFIDTKIPEIQRETIVTASAPIVIAIVQITLTVAQAALDVFCFRLTNSGFQIFKD